MKNSVILFVLFNCSTVISQISEFTQVEKTLQNYLIGSSYNNLEQLESAFAENATLYLTMKDGLFKMLTPKEYVSFFKNGTPGEFNGRYGTLISTEIFKDIATAKAEISFPKLNMIYIDLFLLKKINNEWKIISKTATRLNNKLNIRN